MTRLSILVLAVLLLSPCVRSQDNPLTSIRSPQVSPVVIDRQIPASFPGIASQPGLQRLQSLAIEERGNAQLSISVPPGMPAAIDAQARSVEEAWNSGKYDAALSTYADLGASQDAGRLEATITWRTPVPRSLDRTTAGDVQLGTSDTVTAVDVVCDSSNQQLFAVVAYGTSSAAGYDLLRSTDAGASWSVVSTNITGYVMGSGKTVSIAYVKGKVRLMYLISGNGELRWRQYDNSGAVVPFPSGNYISLAGPGASPSVVEVKAFTNNMYNNNRMYYATILSDHTVHLYWAYPDSSSFSSLGFAGHAALGLSAVWTAYSNNNSDYFVSYVDTASYACIDSVTGLGAWGHKRRVVGYSATSLGYYKDTLVCVHDVSTSPLYCVYEISYNGGKTWNNGSVDTQSVTHDMPAVCLEKGQGMAIVYRYYTPTRQARIITRKYQGPGVWTPPAVFAGYEPFPVQAAITALAGGNWGIVYVAWVAPYRAYFVNYKNPLLSVDPVADRLPEGIMLYQNYPNPFNPSTTIRFDLPAASDVRLKVYDIIGREVSTLVNGRMGAGVHEVRFDGSSLASGVYFCRLAAGNSLKTMKLTLMK